MTDEEFICEVVERVVPRSEWWGETNHDNESVKNISIQLELAHIVLEKLFEDIDIAGQEYNGSAQKIMKEKREALKELLESLDDLPELVGYKIVEIADKENENDK